MPDTLVDTSDEDDVNSDKGGDTRVEYANDEDNGDNNNTE